MVHRLSTSADFAAAIAFGLGWGMVPEPQLVPALQAGALVALPLLASAQDREPGEECAGRGSARFAAADTDGDGLISHDEFASAHAFRFEAADTDGDGMLSEEELRASHHARGGRGGHGDARGGEGHGGRGGHGPGHGRMLQTLDADGDAAVTRDEFAALFDRFDTNGDGVLDEGDRPE